MEQYIFYILSAIIIVFAFLSVTATKLYRATMYLLFVLLAISGVYFLLKYNFMAAVQLSVYAGGIMILLVYAVMLTDRIGEPIRSISTKRKIAPAIITAATAMFAIYAIYNFNVGLEIKGNTDATTVEQVGEKLLSYGDTGFVLPFEVISILLLAAMIGAIVIAKAKKLVNQENI
jgi:NADH-quinone oxidoreductase subunit J